MLTIRNLTKRTVVLNLPHAQACSDTTCTCTRMKVGVEQHDVKTGERTVRAVNQRLGASVTLLPKGARGGEKNLDPLDEAEIQPHAKRAPDVVGALKRGEIVIVEKKEPDPPAASSDQDTGAEE